jgi:hypothetical protein
MATAGLIRIEIVWLTMIIGQRLFFFGWQAIKYNARNPAAQKINFQVAVQLRQHL